MSNDKGISVPIWVPTGSTWDDCDICDGHRARGYQSLASDLAGQVRRIEIGALRLTARPGNESVADLDHARQVTSQTARLRILATTTLWFL